MSRLMIAGLVAATASVFMVASPASAGPGLGLSLGTGMYVDDGVELSPLNAEAMVYWSFANISADLGFLFTLEEFGVKEAELMTIRPGVRVAIPGICYLRGAVPMNVRDDFNYGFLVGVGKTLLNLQALRLFAEVDATFMEKAEFVEKFPIEARIGLEIGF
ncbi:MAG: hypothetical protein FJ109_09270 [Deltaproteobacteria bacterium]|nr:hypothetical protein [Deltaproteobacteria bacterium]